MSKSGMKAGMNKDVLAIGGLVLVLFLIMIVVGVAYVGGGELKETICEQDTTGNEWNESTCKFANNTEATVTAISRVTDVENVILTVLGLLSLVVIVGLFAIVIKAAVGFARGF